MEAIDFVCVYVFAAFQRLLSKQLLRPADQRPDACWRKASPAKAAVVAQACLDRMYVLSKAICALDSLTGLVINMACTARAVGQLLAPLAAMLCSPQCHFFSFIYTHASQTQQAQLARVLNE